MTSIRNPGRVAGLWYLLLVLIGPLRLIIIPDKLFVTDNAAATAANLVANESLFRLGIASQVIGGVVLVFMTMAFYRLFETVDRRLAALVVITGGIMPGLLYFVGAALDGSALLIANGADFLSAFDKPQQDALAMLFLKVAGQQITAAEMLWGVWLLPLGLLTYRSGFLPRFLGVWLGLNGLAYIALCLSGELWPQYHEAIFNYGQPVFIAEIAFMLWLVIKGGRPVEVAPA